MPADVVQQPDPSQGTPPAPDPSQYQVPNPVESGPSANPASVQGNGINAPTETVNVTGQQSPQPQTQNPGSTAQVQPQAPQQAPEGTLRTPKNAHPGLDRLLSTARGITDQLVPTPYKTSIDPNTGETTRTTQPLSRTALSLSLIMEALQGSLAGAGAKGTNATGEAASMGLQQGEKIAAQRQQAQADQDQQAQTDLKTRQQVIMNGIQTRQLAMTMGRQSLEDASKQVEADAPAWQAHQEDPQSILAQGLTKEDAYAQVGKLGYGNAQVLITGAKPRTDPKTGEPLYQINGKIVPKDTPGAYTAPDFTYALVKPDAKISPVNNDGTLKDEYKRAVKQGFASLATGADGKLPADYKMDAKSSQAALRGSQTANAVQADVNRVRAAEGMEPLSDDQLDSDLSSGSDVRNGLNVYNNQLGMGASHAQAMQAVLASKYSSAAGTINGWYGGKDKTDGYDKHAATLSNDSDILHGNKLIATRDDAQQAVASTNPRVQALGKAAFARMDKEDAHKVSTEAFAKESAHVWGEKKIAELKADLAMNGKGEGNLNALAQPAVRNSSGVLVHQAYIDTLPKDTQAQLWSMASGRDEGPNTRTKEGKALDKMLNAAYPTYDKSKFHTYQSVAKDYVDGKKADGMSGLNQMMVHMADAYDHATASATLPIVSGIAGAFGNDNANAYKLATKGFSEEVAKAVKGGLATAKEGDDWLDALKGSNPEEAKSKIRSVLPLVKARIDAQQSQLDKASPIGIAPLRVFDSTAAKSYERVSGNSADTPGSPATNAANPQNRPPTSTPPPQGATSMAKANDGNWYYRDAQGKPIGKVQ